MTKKKLLFLAALIITEALFFLLPVKALAGPGWWNKSWSYRRPVEVSELGQEHGNTDLAWCTFGAGQEMQKDGRDIRVIDSSGKLVAHNVIFAQPGGRCEIVFQSSGPGTYYIYYGNKTAGSGGKQLKLKKGLILETRNRPKGKCNSWTDFQDLLKKSSTIYGRGARKKIYDGFNPYGPSDNYISIYSGYIYCPRPGTYRFATNSDESSFVFINGKKIVEWAGNHGPSAAYGEHNGAVKLEKGLHKIEYYHEEGGGGQACVLGWWTPDAKQVRLVPDSAFPSFLRGRAGAAQKFKSETTCDFVFQYRSDLQLPGNLYCEVAFFDRSRAKGSSCSWIWDFGDGTQSNEQNPVHVYLSPGYYRIKLSITGADGKKDSTIRTIYAGQLFISTSDKKKIAGYLKSTSNYRLDKLNTKSLLGLKSLLEFVNDTSRLVETCKVLVHRATDLSSGQHYEVLLKLGDLLRTELKDAEGAMEIYQKIATESLSKKRTLMGKIGIADVTFQLNKKYDKAVEMYQEIIDNYKNTSLAYCRLAQIRIGDIWREQGNYTKSLEAYEKAKAMRRLIGHLDNALARGQLAITIEAYIREKEYEAALKKLDTWDWEYPEDKLSGYPSILRAKVNYGTKNFDDVIEDLRSLIKVNSGDDVPKRSNYLAEAKYMVAYALLRQKKYEESISMMERMIKEHPESDLLDKAKEVIEDCKKHSGK